LVYQLSFKRLDAAVVVCREIIKWGAIVLLGRYAYLSIAALAGQKTLADIVVRFLGNLTVSNSIAYILAGGGLAYGVGQHQLRRRNIRRIVGNKNDLEKILDRKRTSSELTDSGKTRPGEEEL
jgi:hypothetical protein